MNARKLIILAGILLLVLSACALPGGNSNQTAPAVPSGEQPAEQGAQAVAPTTAPAAVQPAQPTQQPAIPPVQPTEMPAPTQEAHFSVADALSHLSDFALQREDLPNDYYVPSGGETRYTNTQLVYELGELEAKKYIVATGRVDGWKIELNRSNKADIAPARIVSTMELFETNEGARLALSPEWFKAYKSDYTKDEITWLDNGCQVGDQCLLYTHKSFDPSSNLTTTTYEIAFAYRNVVVWIWASGLDIEMNADYVINAAQAVYDRISRFE